MNNFIWRVFWWTGGVLLAAEASLMGDECDWTGSGLSVGESRGVTPVYLRCREGRLTWLYPRGALRLLFQLPSNDQDFTVCIRILKSISDDEEPDVFPAEDTLDFREAPKEKHEAYPARLFLEGARNLLPLYAHNDGDEREVRCFNSRRGRAAVYVEALEGEGLARTVAALRYEARPLPRGHYDPAAADCRPCSDAEMSLAFCTSDLVSRGLIVGMQQRNELDTSQLTLKLTKVIRHTSKDGRTFEEDPLYNNQSTLTEHGGDYYKYDLFEEKKTKKNKKNKRDGKKNRRDGKKKRRKDWRAHVHVPTQCGASHGAGEFMFMARRRLGRLSLTCAPRLEQWAALVETMNAEGSAHCLLKH